MTIISELRNYWNYSYKLFWRFVWEELDFQNIKFNLHQVTTPFALHRTVIRNRYAAPKNNNSNSSDFRPTSRKYEVKQFFSCATTICQYHIVKNVNSTFFLFLSNQTNIEEQIFKKIYLKKKPPHFYCAVSDPILNIRYICVYM